MIALIFFLTAGTSQEIMIIENSLVPRAGIWNAPKPDPILDIENATPNKVLVLMTTTY